MKKALKTTLKISGKILAGFAAGLFLLLLAAGVTLSLPSVQNKLGNFAMKKIGAYMDCEVSVSAAKINFAKRSVRLYDFKILDRHDSVTAYAREGYAVLGAVNDKGFTLQYALLIDPYISVTRYAEDSVSDIMRVFKKLAKRPHKDSAFRKSFEMKQWCIENATYIFNDEHKSGKNNGCMDFKHIHLYDGYAKGRNFYNRIGEVQADIDYLEAKEKCGCKVNDFSCHIYVNKGELHFINSKLKTPQSDVNIDIGLVSPGRSWKDYKYFIERIVFDAHTENSTVSVRDIRYFTPVFGRMDAVIKLGKGEVSGPLSDFCIKNVRAGYGRGTVADGDLRITGIPSTPVLALNLRCLEVQRPDLENLRLPSGGSLLLPHILDYWERASLRGTFNGGLQNFTSRLDFTSNLGNISIENTVVDSLSGPAVMKGVIKGRDIRLDKFLGKDSVLGSTDLDINFFLSGRELSSTVCLLDGEIQNFDLLGRALEPVSLNAHVQKDFYRASVRCSDPDLDFRLMAFLDLRSRESESSVNLLLGNMSLPSFSAGTRLSLKMRGNRLDSLNGRVELHNTRLHRLEKDAVFDRITASLYTDRDGVRRAEIRSTFLDGSLSGNWSFKEMERLGKAVIKRHFPALADSGAALYDTTAVPAPSGPVDFTAAVSVKPQIDTLLALFVPSFYMPYGAEASLKCRKDNPVVALRVDLPYIQYKKTACMNSGLQADFSPGQCGIQIKSDRFYLNERSRISRIVAVMDGTRPNLLSYGFYWCADSAGNSVYTQPSGLEGVLEFLSGGSLCAQLSDAYVSMGGAWWKNLENGSVFYKKDSLFVNKIGLKCERNKSGIKINGEISHAPSSALRIDFKDFSLDHFDAFAAKLKMDLDGEINGFAQVNNFYDDFSLDADLHVDSLYINGKRYGKLFAGSHSTSKDELNLNVKVNDSGRQTLWLAGSVFPKQNNRLQFAGAIKRLPTHFLNGILGSVLKNMDGTMDGPMRIDGNLSSPELHADFETDRLSATIPVLQTRYSFTHFGLNLTSRELAFKDCRFIDPIYKSAGVLSGKIFHRNFKDIRLDMKVDFKNILALNSRRSLDMPFWGTVFGTGGLAITGPLSDISLLLQAKVEDHSEIHFDLANTGSNNGNGFIRFTTARPTQIDTLGVNYEKFYARTRASMRRSTHLYLDLNLETDPGLSVNLDLRNTAMEGKLSAHGNGMLRLVSAPGSTQLFGTYTIGDGSFDFSMGDVINKRFSLENGGTISWYGPMTDARINVKADYHTKAGLYPVLASFSSTEEDARLYRQKANVTSIINLSGSLMSPDIGFEIDLPTADDDSKDKFFAVVKKDDQDEMLRQTFSLLMFNSFMNVSGTGANAGNTALSSSADFVFSQFNNFLSQFTDNINIGMNYRMNDATNNSEFQVSMSGQLFDDRLLINGNLGVTDKAGAAANGTSAVVGEVDVEWKFTEELRLKGFNHSNEQDLTKPINSYTQGVGVVFKREFNNWKEFIHGTKAKLSKEERKAERKHRKEVKKQQRNR